MIKFISFDLEGTLVSESFSEVVWYEGVPRLYSEKYGVSFEEAKRRVLDEYGSVGETRVEWYDIEYWFRRLHIDGHDYRDLLNEYSDRVHYYPEVIDVLDRLRKDYRLIVVTNSSRPFVNVLTRAVESKLFRIYSATSDFRMVKSEELYLRVCEDLGAEPKSVIHVGDRTSDDVLVPRRVGITSYRLDRNSYRTAGEFVVRDLTELMNRL